MLGQPRGFLKFIYMEGDSGEKSFLYYRVGFNMSENITTREDICERIMNMSDEQMFKLGQVLDLAMLEKFDGYNSGVLDGIVGDAMDFIFMLWECSSQHGKREW
jgi:hypothetical protein